MPTARARRQRTRAMQARLSGRIPGRLPARCTVTRASEGFEEFKGFKEFELLWSQEKQILQPIDHTPLIADANQVVPLQSRLLVLNKRRPLRTTMTVLPSWPTTPRGRGMPRVRAATTRVPITAREKTRFSRMVRRVRRLRSMA